MEREFYSQERLRQIKWRENNISSSSFGKQNGKYYPHIVPRKYWEETLWEGIKETLPHYLVKNKITSHTGTHNLLSSWVSAANLYYIIRINSDFKQLFLGFLQKTISPQITKIIDTDLEFSFEGALSPEQLLGERGGSRGSGQTSPDVAFMVETKKGKGILLVECKYTEKSFYGCSARSKKKKSKRDIPNPDATRCMKSADGYDYPSICHQIVWQRKYWDHLQLTNKAHKTLKRCPAATGGYQLFRQQALAEGIAKSGEFDLVTTIVAYDRRNQRLLECMRSTGVPNIEMDWGNLFEGQAIFNTWTHQDWVEYVRENGNEPLQKEWVTYMENRYGY